MLIGIGSNGPPHHAVNRRLSGLIQPALNDTGCNPLRRGK